MLIASAKPSAAIPSSARHADWRVEDEQVGDEMVVLDHLVLFVACRRRHEPAASEPRPLRIAVEVLALVGGGAESLRSWAAVYDGRSVTTLRADLQRTRRLTNCR